MIRECPKCKKRYGGSFVGAMHYSMTKTKIGYFGGYCECGEKLGDGFEWHGVLENVRKVFHKDDLKWRESLSDSEYRRIFGGPRNVSLYIFDYNESFLAKNKNQAKKKFLKLLKTMRRNVERRARLTFASFFDHGPEVYVAQYRMETAGSMDQVVSYLRLKRKKLNVTDPRW